MTVPAPDPGTPLATVESTTRRAVYRGRHLPIAFTSAVATALDDDGGDFPDALGRGTRRFSGAWVKVPRSSIERRYTRSVSATWRGRRVLIDRVVDAEGGPRAGFWLQEMAHDFAREHGLEGSQYDGGYHGVAAVTEFSDVSVREVDHPSSS